MKNEQLILNELKKIRIDIDIIKENFEDITLTQDDLDSISEAEKEFKEGKTTSHEALKEELGN